MMKDSLVVFLEGAKANFKLFGYLTPVFAATIDGEPQIMGVAWNDFAEKELFVNKIKQLISENRLTEFILVAEAWAADTDDFAKTVEHLCEKGSLESWPGRREMVIVTYCSPTEEIDCTADIIRGTISSLGEWKQLERQVKFNSTDFSSRFQGLFLKSKAEQN